MTEAQATALRELMAAMATSQEAKAVVIVKTTDGTRLSYSFQGMGAGEAIDVLRDVVVLIKATL